MVPQEVEGNLGLSSFNIYSLKQTYITQADYWNGMFIVGSQEELLFCFKYFIQSIIENTILTMRMYRVVFLRFEHPTIYHCCVTHQDEVKSGYFC